MPTSFQCFWMLYDVEQGGDKNRARRNINPIGEDKVGPIKLNWNVRRLQICHQKEYQSSADRPMNPLAHLLCEFLLQLEKLQFSPKQISHKALTLSIGQRAWLIQSTHKNTRKHPIAELGIYGYICGYAARSSEKSGTYFGPFTTCRGNR